MCIIMFYQISYNFQSASDSNWYHKPLGTDVRRKVDVGSANVLSEDAPNYPLM